MATTMRARPTVYKGIRMRSRLEAGYAAWLDKWGFNWAYEPECFANDQGQYLPDFLLRNVRLGALDADHRADVYVEVKPASWDGGLDELGRRMGIIYSSHSGADVLLERPGQPPLLYTHAVRPGDGNWLTMTWTYQVAWPSGVEFLALSSGLERRYQPWPDGYWKAGG